MKLSTLMKDYIGQSLLTESKVHDGLLPESFMGNSDLPLHPYKREWSLLSGPERLIRTYTFKDLRQRSLFIEELMSAEESHGHHAKITILGYEVTVEVWTHDIDSVTELDKEYSSMCDELFNDVSLIGFDYNEY